MKILFLTFYYEPDLCAGSFRSTALVRALLDKLPSDAHIELVTTLPNRYSSFATEAPVIERYPRLTIHRIALPSHKCGLIDQSKAFVEFSRGVLRLYKGADYDLVFATSSRLMTAALGAYVSRRIKAPLYLDIRDIFVDTINDVLPKKIVWALKPLFSAVERWTMHSAIRINLVSAGFKPYFMERYPEQNYVFFTNGIDDEFVEFQHKKYERSKSDILSVVYAGNFGEGQGLHTIVPYLCRKFSGRIHFKLIGDGGRRQQLLSAIEAEGCLNVEILPPVKRDQLLKFYQNADVLFLHLNDYEAFKKVLPSKLFEYGATGKPIWAGVAGYAADFINKNIPNAAVFTPCNVKEAVASFETLDLVTERRDTFVENFARVNVMQRMASDIIFLAGRY